MESVLVLRSHGVLEKRMVARVDAAVVRTDEQLGLSSEVVDQVRGALPHGRRTPVCLQLRPLVTDDHCNRVRQRNLQLDSTRTFLTSCNSQVSHYYGSILYHFIIYEAK